MNIDKTQLFRYEENINSLLKPGVFKLFHVGVRSFTLVLVDESDVSSGKVAEKFIIEEITAVAALDGVKDVAIAVVLGCVERLLSGGIYNYRSVHRFGPCRTTGKVRVVLWSDTCGG